MARTWDFQASCTTDIAKFHKLIKRERVYDFLAGVNDIFYHIRILVLKRDPFPSLRQAYSYVQRKEGKHNILILWYQLSLLTDQGCLLTSLP